METKMLQRKKYIMHVRWRISKISLILLLKNYIQGLETKELGKNYKSFFVYLVDSIILQRFYW